MDTGPDSPLFGEEPTLPPREGLNKPLIFGLLAFLGVAIFALLVWAVAVWLNPAPPPPPAAVPQASPALQTPPLPLESLMRDAFPTSFANQDRRPAMPEAQLVQEVPPPPPPKKDEPPPPPPADGAKATPEKKEPAVKTAGSTTQSGPKKKTWGFLSTGAGGSKAGTPRGAPGEATKGAHLIDPGVWAIPENVHRTLYRTQVLPCELLQKIDSDAPGQIQLGLTVPVFGFYGQGDELFPKGSKVIALPAGRPEFGAKTLEVKLEQIHLPSGAVVEIPGDVGNEDGSNQLSGTVNNHWGELLAAAGINALVSLGGGYLAGTPGSGQFYLDPAQRAMQEAGQSVQQDVKTVVSRSLKRGPTITRDPTREGERFCTIQLLKNMQFSDRPLMVKQEGRRP